jgi:hypothetical protein
MLKADLRRRGEKRYMQVIFHDITWPLGTPQVMPRWRKVTILRLKGYQTPVFQKAIRLQQYDYNSMIWLN